MKSTKPKKIEAAFFKKVDITPSVIRDYLFRGSLWEDPIVVSTVKNESKEFNGYVTQIDNLPVRSMRDYKSDIVEVSKTAQEASIVHKKIVEGWRNKNA